MSQFYGISLSGIAKSLLSGKPMASIGYGYAVVGDTVKGFEHPDLEAVAVNTRGMGNHGSFFLRGKTPRGRRVVRKATLRQWRKAGLSAFQAEMFYQLSGKWKHELVGQVVHLLSLPREAAETFPNLGGHHYVAWAARWGKLEGSFPRAEAAASFARQIWAISYGPAPKYNPLRSYPTQGKGWRLIST